VAPEVHIGRGDVVEGFVVALVVVKVGKRLNSLFQVRWALPSLTREKLGKRLWNLISTLPDTLCLRFPDAPPVRVVHGSPRSHFESMHPLLTDAQLAEMLAKTEESTVVCGHTHLPMDRKVQIDDGRSWHVINTGTVGIPLDIQPDATYAILDGDESGWQATIHHVPVDYELLWRGNEEMGFTERLGVTGHLIIREVREHTLWLLPYLNWKAQKTQGEEDSLDLLTRFFEEVSDTVLYLPPEYR
jgi:diadenosine tetraphosphatase ApaH/serine/threonine PP2A family protein phosphatase